MKEFIRKNLLILLAFALPVILIVVVAVSAYLPSALLSTNYNFVYSSCNLGEDYYPYNCAGYMRQLYSVVDGKLVLNAIPPNQDSDKNGIMDINENYSVRIFLHDTQKNESREITLTEARALELNGLLTSPDGVTVSSNYDRGPGFLFFDSGSSYGYYLAKGNDRSKLNLINRDDQYYYQDNFRFIGWTPAVAN